MIKNQRNIFMRVQSSYKQLLLLFLHTLIQKPHIFINKHTQFFKNNI